jgi:KDO2-lipid IV(A) lauroyltransferase
VGNWELGGLMLSRMGYPVTAVYRPLGFRHLDRMFTGQRTSRGIQLIPLGHAVPGLLRALRSGRVISLLADRDFTGRGQFHNFFGVPARLPMGAAILALKTGAPIVPAFMLRQVDDRFLLKFYPPIIPAEGSTVDELQAAVVTCMESIIGEYPYQWFIFHDFWRDAESRRGSEVPGGSAPPAGDAA